MCSSNRFRYGFVTLAVNIKFSIGFGLVESKVSKRTATSGRSEILFSPRTKITLIPDSSSNDLVIVDALKSVTEKLKPVNGAISVIADFDTSGIGFSATLFTELGATERSSSVGVLSNLNGFI